MRQVVIDPFYNCAFCVVNGVMMYTPLHKDGAYSVWDVDWVEMTSFEENTIGETFHFSLIKLLLNYKQKS